MTAGRHERDGGGPYTHNLPEDVDGRTKRPDCANSRAMKDTETNMKTSASDDMIPQTAQALNTNQNPRFSGMSAFSGRILVSLANRTPHFPTTKDGKAVLTTIDRGRILTSELGYSVTEAHRIAGPDGIPTSVRFLVTRPERTKTDRRTGETIRESDHTYTVDLTVRDGEIVEADCECEMFARAGTCLHIERVALQVERELHSLLAEKTAAIREARATIAAAQGMYARGGQG